MKAAVIAIVAVVALYGAVVGYFTFNQARYFYYPDRARADLAQARLPGFSAVEIVTEDGERIVGWWKPPEGLAGSVLYLHGNGGNLAMRADRLRDAAATGAGVLAIDYRGYGGSTGRPSEKGLYTDARSAWRFIGRQAPGRPVVAWGESLGTAVAVQLATEVDLAGVVLDSPFASAQAMVRSRAPWFPPFLIAHRYDTIRKVGRIDAPLLVVHCDLDAQVPFSDGQAVFATAAEPKRFVRVPGCGHIDIWRDPGKAAILQFLRARLGAQA
jgi:uncharacterized protein